MCSSVSRIAVENIVNTDWHALQSGNDRHHRAGRVKLSMSNAAASPAPCECHGYQTYNAALRGGSGGTFARCRKLPILTQFAPLTGGKWVVFLEIRLLVCRVRVDQNHLAQSAFADE
ncbi:hypothetical protein Poly51_63190 [Rubripirellula tenax]|uniref:Uncharacterized protein n=1 Tax=Rubripirellula tenax TaxID=2528015 RepID=A0A5C6E6J3_9BACT|nr:hypothetical protein Poly51_63190 [Rubripirellula tenax]